MKVSQILCTTNYKPTIEQHDGLIMIENILILLSCIYVQKYNYMNNNYFLWLIDCAFTVACLLPCLLQILVALSSPLLLLGANRLEKEADELV
jgi:hypothetical protein